MINDMISKDKNIDYSLYELTAERERLIWIRDKLTTERDRLRAEYDILLNSNSLRITKYLKKIKAFLIRYKTLYFFTKSLLYIYKRLFKFKKKEKKSDYFIWIEQNEPNKNELKQQKKTLFSYRPKISIVIPMYNTPIEYFKELINSIQAQTYDNWELCLADGSTEMNNEIKSICSSDKRINYSFLNDNKGVSGNTNEAIKLATGDYIAFMDHDDTLAPFALYENIKCINEHPDIEFIYSDEDNLINNMRCNPYIKPDFAPDTLHSVNYICHFIVMKRSLVECLGELNSEYDGAQDYDYVLRASEVTKNIYHIRKILYHYRKNKKYLDKLSNNIFYISKKALDAHIERLRLKGKTYINNNELGYFNVIYDIIGNPSISIVIPNKDNITNLKFCVDSIIYRSTYSNYEIVIVENNSKKEETFAFYHELEKKPKIRVLYFPDKGFNYSKLINFGIKKCSSNYIVQLNNDTEVITPNWLELLLGFAQRSDVGAVGAKLLYPDGTIQHAGMYISYTNNQYNILHIYQDNCIRNYIAVTGACLMSRRENYENIGYMDENLAEDFNDIDFCFSLRSKGLLIVYNNNVELYHYECKTRGYDDTPEKKRFFIYEKNYFFHKWDKILKIGDPFFNQLTTY